MKQNRKIQGLKINNRGPVISRLLFADDAVLFSKASPFHCSNMLEILKDYEECSGQKGNLNKSTIFLVVAPPIDSEPS